MRGSQNRLEYAQREEYMNRTEQQAAGTHPAPCARHCEAEKDAARYRWLRDLPKGSCHGSGMTITIAKARPDPCSWMNDSVRGDDMDAAIDAAMQSTEAGDSIQGEKK